MTKTADCFHIDPCAVYQVKTVMNGIGLALYRRLKNDHGLVHVCGRIRGEHLLDVLKRAERSLSSQGCSEPGKEAKIDTEQTEIRKTVRRKKVHSLPGSKGSSAMAGQIEKLQSKKALLR